MLVETLFLALAIALLRGGRLRNLGKIDLKGLWLVVAAGVVQLTVFWSAEHGLKLGPAWLAPVLHTLSYLLVFFVALKNLSEPGIRWLAFGVMLNALVIGSNGGQMPVDLTMLSPEGAQALTAAGGGTHGPLLPTTRLSFLADRIFIAIPGIGKQLFSIGDVMIDIGIFSLVYDIMTKPVSHRIRKAAG